MKARTMTVFTCDRCKSAEIKKAKKSLNILEYAFKVAGLKPSFNLPKASEANTAVSPLQSENKTCIRQYH